MVNNVHRHLEGDYSSAVTPSQPQLEVMVQADILRRSRARGRWLIVTVCVVFVALAAAQVMA